MKLRIRTISLIFIAILIIVSASCQKKEVLQAEEPEPVADQNPEPCPGCEFPDYSWPQNNAAIQLVFRLRFDSSLASLNSYGGAFVLSPGHAAQSPTMVTLALDQLELMPDKETLPGTGAILYTAPKTSCAKNGTYPWPATNFCKLHLIGESEIVFSIALNALPPGNYKWLRLLVAYSEMKIMSRTTSSGNAPATFAGFYAEKTFVSKIKTETSVLTPTFFPSNYKSRGSYLFEQDVFGQKVIVEGLTTHHTVVHYNMAQPFTFQQMFVEFTDPSGQIPKPLQVTGNENISQEVQLIFGTNKLFEWQEKTADGLYQPEIGEMVYDFGFRNLQARH